MQKHNFSPLLTNYLTEFLPRRNVSGNTISSYCDTFKLLLRYLRDEHKLNIDKLCVEQVSSEIILLFLKHLQTQRNCNASTQNQRLNAVRSLFKFISSECPYLALHCNRILQIPKKKTTRPLISYIDETSLKEILQKPDITKTFGLRDLAILSVTYDTGARVQEIVDLTVRDVRLDTPPKIRLLGKGRKYRFVPLMPNTVSILKKYLEEYELISVDKGNHKLFFNRNSNTITRAGIAYILKKYSDSFKTVIGSSITPHVLRHTKAMHLLQAGVNIIYIKDILGHEDINTTQVYTQADMQMKTTALEKATNLVPPIQTSWHKDRDLLSWLDNLSKAKPNTQIGTE